MACWHEGMAKSAVYVAMLPAYLLKQGLLQGHAVRQGLRLKKPSATAAPFVGVFELGGASAQVLHSVLLSLASLSSLTTPHLRGNPVLFLYPT